MTVVSSVPTVRSLAPTRAPALVVAVVAAVTAVSSALADPNHGADGWLALGLLVVRTTTDLAVLGTIGSLVLALCLPGGPTSPAAAAVLRGAAAWAGWWTLLLATTLASEVLAPASLVAHGAIGPDISDLDIRLRWLVAGIVLAAVTRILAGSVRGVVDGWVVLAVASSGLVPATLTGHGGTDQSWLVAGSILAHVLAVSAWAGGLLALVMHARQIWAVSAGPGTVQRFSRVALACYVAVAGTGVLTVLSQSSLTELLRSQPHFALLVGKVSVLVLLGLAGAAQRAAVIPRLQARGPALLVLVAAAELVLMATAMGLAVTLTHTAS